MSHDEELSPASVAEKIFSKNPKQCCSVQLLSDDCIDTINLFEILITIMMEGLCINNNNLEHIDLKNFNQNYIHHLNPWFNSIGYDIECKAHDSILKPEFDKYYCRIVVKTKLYKTFFEIKNTEKNFHFLVNGNHLKDNLVKKNINEIYAVFNNDETDLFYTIRFYHKIPNTNMRKLL